MAATAAQLLDELMGRDRNRPASERRAQAKWDDTDVCKYNLCGFCPHDLFVNTRADLGNCEKLHDDNLQREYQKSGRFERMGYEEDMIRFLQTLIAEVERRIRRGHQRLLINSKQGSLNVPAETESTEEKIQNLTEKINDLVNQAEELGCEGKVDEAQSMMKNCDQLVAERQQLETNAENLIQQGTPEFEKTMEVCEVCGALLVVGDAQQRIDEHLMGKQHMGYARIRAYVEGKKLERQKKQQAVEDEMEARLTKERDEREKEREKEREERRKREEEREKERKKEREQKRRSRSRDRDRHSDRSRDRKRSSSRDRSRRKRSRSREHKRSRSHDHDRKSGNGRSKRSRSGERRSRSRSRSKHSHGSRHKSRSKSKDRRSDEKRDKEKRKSEDEPVNGKKLTGQSEEHDTQNNVQNDVQTDMQTDVQNDVENDVQTDVTSSRQKESPVDNEVTEEANKDE